MCEAFEANAYNKWLTAKVNEALQDLAHGTNPAISAADWGRIRAEKIRQRANLANIGERRIGRASSDDFGP